MRSKLLILLMVATIGIIGCSKKEEEATAVSPTPSVEPQQTAAPNAQTQTVSDQNTTAQETQTNAQPQEQSLNTNVAQQPQTSIEQASPVVTVTNDTPAQNQATTSTTSDNLTPPVAPTANQAPTPEVQAQKTQANTAPTVVEQPKQQ